MKRRGVAYVVLAAVVLGGCGGSSSTASTATTTIDPLVALLNVPPFPDIPTPTIGPVDAPTPSNDSEFCRRIAGDEALRTLPSALSYLTHPDLAEEAQSSTNEAVAALAALAPEAPGGLDALLSDAADALQDLLDGDGEAVTERAVTALDELGQGVHDECGF